MMSDPFKNFQDSAREIKEHQTYLHFEVLSSFCLKYVDLFYDLIMLPKLKLYHYFKILLSKLVFM